MAELQEFAESVKVYAQSTLASRKAAEKCFKKNNDCGLFQKTIVSVIFWLAKIFFHVPIYS